MKERAVVAAVVRFRHFKLILLILMSNNVFFFSNILGGTFIFLLNSVDVAVPLMVAAGGGGLGVGHFSMAEDNQQHGRVHDSARDEVSGQRHGDTNATGGAGKHHRPTH